MEIVAFLYESCTTSGQIIVCKIKGVPNLIIYYLLKTLTCYVIYMYTSKEGSEHNKRTHFTLDNFGIVFFNMSGYNPQLL